MKRLYILVMAVSVMALTCLAGACGSASGAAAPKSVRYSSTTDPVLAVVVDSVDYRTDLTRVYGKLVGRPHTSGRVDGATFLSGKISRTATDIDGIDFNRYFQWEDDGVIPVEIDFPAISPVRTARLVLTTSRGESVTNIKRK